MNLQDLIRSGDYTKGFEREIKGVTYYFWFRGDIMRDKCLAYHRNKLSVFKGTEQDSLCAHYKYLHSVKDTFTNQEWCDKFFRSQERGGNTTSEHIELREFTAHERHILRRRDYNAKAPMVIRDLWEARNDPDFKLVCEWTSYEPCMWLDKLVSANHFLCKNLGKWVRITYRDPRPNVKQGWRFFPYKLIHLEKHKGEIVYHAENQLTLPYGVQLSPKDIRVITIKQAKVLYQYSVKTHLANFGNPRKTDLLNPKDIDLVTKFNPDLTWATWEKYSKCNEFVMKDGKKNYGQV